MGAPSLTERPAARDRLLTTREAATFLKDSNASIRRWTEGVDAVEAVHAGLLMLYPEVSGSASEQVARFEQLLTAASRRRPGPIRILAQVAADVETVGSVAEHLLVEQQLDGLCKRRQPSDPGPVAVCEPGVSAQRASSSTPNPSATRFT